MNSTYTPTHKRFKKKKKLIDDFINKDFYAVLKDEETTIKQRKINGKMFYFNPKDKEPYRSFSSLTTGLYGKHIPEFALNIAAKYGNNLMKNIEDYFYSGVKILDEEIMSEKDIKIFEAFVDFLNDNEFDIIAVEKFFINPETKEYGFIDLFVKDKFGEKILIEVKTRNDLIISNTTKAQAYYYKKNCHNIKSGVLQINRKTYKTKFEIVSAKEGSKYLRIVRLFHEQEKWNNIKIVEKGVKNEF